MKRLVLLASICCSLLCLLSSCEKAPFLVLNTPNSITFPEQGGTQTVSFSANRDWTISSSESWCIVSPPSGTKSEGEVSFSISCDPNPNYDSRNATVTIKAESLMESITVTQDTKTGFLIDKWTYNLDNRAQVVEINVWANVGYDVEIEEQAKSWLSTTHTKALSLDKLVLNVAANDTYDDREGKVIIRQNGGGLSETITIKQGQSYGLFVTIPEYELSNESHVLTVEIKSNVQYEIESEAQWIKYTQPTTKGLVSSQITLGIDANESYDKREGKVKVKQVGGELSGEIIIRQSENYGLSVFPESFNLTKDAQSVEVDVSFNVEFDVIIPEADQGSFISSVEALEEGKTKALSSRTYRICVTENELYSNRSSSITFKQKDGPLSGTVSIDQESNDVSGLGPFVRLVYSSRVVNHIQIVPSTVKWTIYWGDGQFSYSPGKTDHVFDLDGSHTVLVSGSDITEFSTSIRGLELIDLSNFK